MLPYVSEGERVGVWEGGEREREGGEERERKRDFKIFQCLQASINGSSRH